MRGWGTCALLLALGALLAAATGAPAAWDCNASTQPACPASAPVSHDGSLPVRSALLPLARHVRGEPLFDRRAGHLEVGLNEGSVGNGSAQPDQAAAFGTGLGAAVVRIPLNWAFTEAAPGKLDWRAWDRRYRAYTAAGIRPIWAIQASPQWAAGSAASADACSPHVQRGAQSTQECLVGPPSEHVGDYAAFAARVARRYPLSAAVEVWNEPNLDYYWRDPDASAYSALANATAGAVHSAAPSMRVLVGALAAPLYNDRHGVRLDTFAAALAASGAATAADGVSLHPYPGTPDAAQFRSAFAQLADALGPQSPTRLVADELGASTGPRPPGQYQFTEDEQRDVVLATYSALDRGDADVALSRNVDAVVFHTDVDGDAGFGFLRAEPDAAGGFVPRPVFCAIEMLVRSSGLCGLPVAGNTTGVTPASRKHASRACAKARRERARWRAVRARSRREGRALDAARVRRHRARARALHRRCRRSRADHRRPQRR